jgi:citrate synthase
MSQPSHTLASDAELTALGKTLTLPLMEGSEGEVAIDIGALRRETGWITMDPGYVNTGACTSAITFIDGEKGILRYRGYPIEQLAEKSSFLAVAWLLMYGELPTDAELAKFADEVRAEAALPDDLKHLYGAMPKDGHPMPVTAAAVSALATRCAEPESDEEVHRAFVQLLGKLPTIAAWCHNHAEGQPFADPAAVQGDYAERFLRMMFGASNEVDPVVARALDLLLILHADHEQNCSTSTVRLVGSSKAHLFAAISAGVQALWGPLHGGANQAVIEMLEEIEQGGGSAAEFLERAKDKNDSVRLMGFGHRVYKSYDPRAKVLKSVCNDVLGKLGKGSKLLEIAMELEEITLKDDYFISRSLYPNVDFYSGVIYKALGIPTDMFTVMFVLGRLPGWIAQWYEMRRSPEFRIGRPRQVYTGPTERAL